MRMAHHRRRARPRCGAPSSSPRTPGVPLGPNPRVGCVLLDDAGAEVAEGFHRGAGTPARRGRRAAPRRRAARAAPPRSSPSSPATTPAAPVRAPQALLEAGVRRVVFAQPDPNPVAAGRRRHPARGRGRGRGRAAGRRGARGSTGPGPSPSSTAARSSPGSSPPPSTAAAPPPTAPAAGSPARPPAATPTGSGRCATRCWSAPAPSLVDDPAAHRPRRARPAAAAHQPLRVVMGERDLDPGQPGLRRRAPRPSTCAPATRTRRSPSSTPATASTSSSRAARRWPRRSSQAGLVDEVVAYVAPMLLGAGRNAVGDLGIGTIADALPPRRSTDVTVARRTTAGATATSGSP